MQEDEARRIWAQSEHPAARATLAALDEDEAELEQLAVTSSFARRELALVRCSPQTLEGGGWWYDAGRAWLDDAGPEAADKAYRCFMRAAEYGSLYAFESLVTMRAAVLEDEASLTFLANKGYQRAIMALGNLEQRRDGSSAAQKVYDTADVLHKGETLVSLGLWTEDQLPEASADLHCKLDRLAEPLFEEDN